jgi:antitoxin component of RelBE/YafQ-DinJ toxin-antitoxin module
MDLPTAIRMFTKQIAVTRSVPLLLSLDSADFGEGYVKKLEDAISAYNNGEVTYRDLIEA